MRMNRLLLLVCAMFTTIWSEAQLLTWTPPFPVDNDPSQTLVITMDATKGNQGLKDYTPTSNVYVHIGVITNKSTNPGNWQHVPFQWATTPSEAQTQYLGNNKWSYTISGSLRTFFNVTDPTEIIQKIAILFRSGDGNTVQRNADLSDMFVPIYSTALAVRIDNPPSEPKYFRTPETQNWIVGSTINVTANANKTSTLKLYHNGNLIAGPVSGTSISGSSTVAAIGNQQLVAEANDGSTTQYDTLNIFVSGPGSPKADLPSGVRDGINYEVGDSTVILVLRAPGKNKVVVIGDFNNWTQDINYLMNRTPDGKFFWIRLHNLTSGTEYAYQYLVDDVIKIADPYTEKILDPNNDPGIPTTVYPNLKPYPTGKTTGIVSILQTGAAPYSWTINNFNRPDKRNLVIYELLIRDFVQKHDWKTLQDSLNYFRTLGINAIELMPINEFEGNDSWGYNPDFYFAPDKYYGTKNALKQFIDSCHKSGIAVIMDIALNHSFGSSPMVQLYFDNQNNRPAPNNPWFNPVAKHAFNVGYDMNHESLDTKYFVSRVMEHWTQQYKIDGFRFDLAKGFTQKQTCDNSGNNCNVAAWGNYDSSRVAIWKGYYDSLQLKSSGAYAILEHFADNSEEKVLADYGMMLWGNMNANYAQAALGFNSPDPGGNLPDFSGAIYTNRSWTKPLLVAYMESHDEERIQYKNEQYGNSSGNYNIKDIPTGLKRVEMDGAFFYTIPGPKMLWQFGELGYDYSINTCSDGVTIDNSCRLSDKPIRWDYLSDANRKHLHDEFASLIKLRFHPLYKDVMVSGNTTSSLSSPFKWMKIASSQDTSDIMVIGNFDVVSQSGSVTFPSAGIWYDYLNNITFQSTGTAQSLTYSPGEFHVFVNRNLNNLNITAVPDVNNNSNILQLHLYPNPVTSYFTLQLSVPESGTGSVQLYNSQGQLIGTLKSGFFYKGNHEFEFSRPGVSSGTYYLKVITKSAIKTLKITL